MRNLRRFFQFIPIAIGVVVLSISTLTFAQNLTGEIDGTVRDSSGALIPGAAITVTNVDQNTIARRLQTDKEGHFAAPLLAIGNYSITGQPRNLQLAIKLKF